MLNFVRAYSLPLVLGALFLFSCGKEDDSEAEPDTASQHCIIHNITRFYNGYETPHYYNYDGQRRLKSVMHGSNLHESKIAYNAAGRISQIDNFYNGKIEDYETYEYDAKGLLTKRNDFFTNVFGTPPTLKEYYTYEYDNVGRVTKRSRFDAAKNEVISYSTYSYYGFTACYKTTYIKDNYTGTFPYTRSETYTFDDKKSYQNLLGVVNENLYKLTVLDERVSYHNTLSLKSFSDGTDYVYEYNAQGYPVKITDNEDKTAPGVTTLFFDCE